MGMVDARGYDGQQKMLFVTCGPSQTIRSAIKSDFRLIGYTYELLKCLDIEIWRFSWWQQQTDRQIDYFTPVHAYGVITVTITKTTTCIPIDYWFLGKVTDTRGSYTLAKISHLLLYFSLRPLVPTLLAIVSFTTYFWDLTLVNSNSIFEKWFCKLQKPLIVFTYCCSTCMCAHDRRYMYIVRVHWCIFVNWRSKSLGE